MINESAIVGVLTLIALFVFFWKRYGVGSGRRFGNQIAKHIGVPRSLFHSLLAHGLAGSSGNLLASLEKSKLTLIQASVELGPVLSKGAERLEAHFGSQESLDNVKPIIKKLLLDYNNKATILTS